MSADDLAQLDDGVATRGLEGAARGGIVGHRRLPLRSAPPPLLPGYLVIPVGRWGTAHAARSRP
jgi:hypothetical protein